MHRCSEIVEDATQTRNYSTYRKSVGVFFFSFLLHCCSTVLVTILYTLMKQLAWHEGWLLHKRNLNFVTTCPRWLWLIGYCRLISFYYDSLLGGCKVGDVLSTLISVFWDNVIRFFVNYLFIVIKEQLWIMNEYNASLEI